MIRALMSLSEETPSLGRAEPALRLIGFAIWAYVGVSRALASSLHPPPPWLWAWGAYGVAYALSGFHRSFAKPVAVGLLAVQTLATTAWPHLGLKEFEGLSLSIVAAQVPTVLPLRWSILWAVGQWLFLGVAIYPLGSRSGIDIYGAYSTFSAFSLLLYYLHGQERRARQAAADANADLIAARALVVERTRESERLRISRELHDSLGHHLTALRIQLELAGRVTAGPPAEPLLRAQDISREALAEVRRVVREMQRPEGVDLAGALRALASGVPVPRIIIAEPLPEVGDPALAHALFRCAQEAITNSLKHAYARNIWVALSTHGASLELLVRDDGRGGARFGLNSGGLTGMQERLSELGGSVELAPGPGSGTQLRVQVPFGKE
jgi:signal transduction histidine kinase